MDGRTFVRTLLPAILGLGLALSLTQCQRIADPVPTTWPPAATSTTVPGAQP